MSEYMPQEETAREMARPILERFQCMHVPLELWPYVEEAVVDAVHDGLIIGESLGAQDDRPGRMEHYLLGVLDTIRMIDRGQANES